MQSLHLKTNTFRHLHANFLTLDHDSQHSHLQCRFAMRYDIMMLL
jgi:hypothetical protein